jgi:HD-GYP domain-containing protein (c-di-GMP phosphodiesterase class II)
MEEQIEYKTHPISGYEELKNESWLSDTSKSIVLSHHERLDGSGYPFKERDFSPECKIVQVCDEFDELISGIACKPTKVYEAVEYMKVYSGVKFDSQIVENLLAFTAVYPVGTVVRTNEGEEAIVLHQNLKFPDRPVIRIIRDKDGKEVAGFNIKDMLKIHTLFIEDAENF